MNFPFLPGPFLLGSILIGEIQVETLSIKTLVSPYPRLPVAALPFQLKIQLAVLSQVFISAVWKLKWIFNSFSLAESLHQGMNNWYRIEGGPQGFSAGDRLQGRSGWEPWASLSGGKWLKTKQSNNNKTHLDSSWFSSWFPIYPEAKERLRGGVETGRGGSFGPWPPAKLSSHLPLPSSSCC